VISTTRNRLAITSGLVAVGLSAAEGTRAQRWKTVVSSRQVTNEEALRVNLEYGAGTLTVRRGDAGTPYRVVLRYDEDTAEPVADYEAGTLNVGMSVAKGWRLGKAAFGNRSAGNSVELQIGPDVPVELHLSFGAGEAELDLTGIPVRDLELSTGASESTLRVDEANPEIMESARFNVGVAEFRIRGLGNLNAKEVSLKAGLGSVTLDLDGEWPAECRLSLEMGLGALNLRTPESLGIRLRHQESWLATVDFNGLVRHGDTWLSPNWNSADRQLEIDVTAALGSIDLVRMR